MANFREKWNLSHQQFLFCQEYLKNFNAEAACKKVYGPGKNGSNVIRSRNVLVYLRYRLDIVHEAAEVNYDYLMNVLKRQLDDKDSSVRAAASRTLQMALRARDEVDAKLKAIEAMEKPVESNINIKIEEHKKED